MNLRKVGYEDSDFMRIRDFLIESYGNDNNQHNWMIDRWNFCRYVSQIFHGTANTWPETVGIWVDENNSIKAVVNSEGENEGEAFFQLRDEEYSPEIISGFIDHAEEKLKARSGSSELVNIRVNSSANKIKSMLMNRGYSLLDWKESTSSMLLTRKLEINLPNDFMIVDAASFTDYQKWLAHSRAFGYCIDDKAENENAFTSLKRAPDYNASLDLAVMNKKREVAAFAAVWYDEKNQIGILEPVGTIPQYRKTGLAKAVVYEGMNRILELGAKKIYVGSGQQFYKSMGFTVEYEKDIWQRKW